MRYRNREVARIFVGRHGRIEAKGSHYRCEDGILYSYSTPVGIWSWKLRDIYSRWFNGQDISFPTDKIFLTERRYSQTTACHESHLRYSANGQLVEVPEEIDTLMNKPSGFLVCLKEKSELCKTKLARSRKDYTREQWQCTITTYKYLSKVFSPIALLEAMKYPERRLGNVNLDCAANNR